MSITGGVGSASSASGNVEVGVESAWSATWSTSGEEGSVDPPRATVATPKPIASMAARTVQPMRSRGLFMMVPLRWSRIVLTAR